MAKGGTIDIKPSNRGKFTEQAERRGMGVQTFASKVLSNPGDYSETTRKRAQFAKNATKFNHASGGMLGVFAEGGNLNISIDNQGQHGGQFSNGLTSINAGGTHESNPYGGVMLGIDDFGIPNLVEEGEVRYGDYIFSNRLSADEELLESFNLDTSFSGKSFAEIAKKISEESSERPNDPISLNGLNTIMSRLTEAQELIRLSEEGEQLENVFATGGSIEDLFRMPNEKELATSSRSTSTDSKGFNFGLSDLRYAPVVGSAIGVFSDLIGGTNNPDYTEIDNIQVPEGTYREVSANPIGNYMDYRPLDREFYLNRLSGQAGATRRGLADACGGR